MQCDYLRGEDWTSFFWLWISSCPQSICRRDSSFTIEWSCHSCQMSCNNWCLGLFLYCQLHSIDLYARPCANTKLSWWLLFCNTILNQESESSYFILSFQDGFGYTGPLTIPYEFWNQLINFCKKYQLGCWEGLCWIKLRNSIVVTTLNLPTNENEIFPQLLRFTLIYFNKVF